MSKSKSIVIIGASSGVGKAVAYQFALLGYNTIIAARTVRDLEAISNDINLKFGTKCDFIELNIIKDSGSFKSFFSKALELSPNGIGALYVTVGQNSNDDNAYAAQETIDQITQANFIGVTKLISIFSNYFEKENVGTLAVCSSIAAQAPRTKNMIYSSAKAGLETYCRGLQHHLADKPVHMQVFALGYVDTQLSYGQKLLFPVASPESVAKYICSKLNKPYRFGYFPQFWTLIVFALKCLPWFMYKKLKF